MKAIGFAGRNAKEMLRDKLTIIFGLCFPLVLLLMLSIIQSNVPVEIFSIDKLSPGIIVFGYSFISLFSGLVISRDRCSSFMLRLFASPMRASDFIVGYALPLLPMAVAQSLVCFAAALALGLHISTNILLCLAVMLPCALVFIALGILCGSLFTDKQVGGICGALLTNLSAWLSGTWFDLSLIGKSFEKVALWLPFASAVQAGRAALSGDYAHIMPGLIRVIVWAAVLSLAAIIVFSCKMKSDRK